MGVRRKTEYAEEQVDIFQNDVTTSKKIMRAAMWAVVIGVPTVLAITLGIKNRDVISTAWATMQEEIKKGKPFSSKWFDHASLEELYECRDPIHEAYMNPELDQDIRNMCWNLLGRIDNKIHDLRTIGQPVGSPVTREHGWYLLSKD